MKNNCSLFSKPQQEMVYFILPHMDMAVETYMQVCGDELYI